MSRRLYNGVVVGTVAAACAHAQPLAAPVPEPIFDSHMLPMNYMKSFRPRSAIRIPTGGQVSWPIECSGNFNTDRVSLQLRDFFHHSTSDLSMHLEHDGKSAVIVPQFGQQDKIAFGHTNDDFVVDEKHLRVGRDYSFDDGNFSSITHNTANSNNIALGGNATQSSTYASYVAGNAVNGDIHGLRSEFGISMTTQEEQNRYNAGQSDHEPWWQVDLGQETDVGTIVLWAPETEPTIRALEVQTVTLTVPNATAALAADYWYTLQFSYGGTTYETGAIDFGAPACAEAGCNFVDDSGESFQAKLQELPNIWHVTVTREDVFVEEFTGAEKTHSDLVHTGYVYTITFTVPVRDAPQLEYGDYFDFGPNFSSISDVVELETVTNAEVVEMPFVGSEEPTLGYVMVSVDPIPDNASLAEALRRSDWHASLKYGSFRQKRFIAGYNLSQPMRGRYVRVQLGEFDNLQFAEVEVFSEIANVLSHYQGGSPITAGTYVAEDNLSELFRGTPATGSWILRLVDSTDPTAYSEHTSKVFEEGALNDWVLSLQDTDGNFHELYSGISTEVQTLPACGRLYKVLSDGVTTEEIVAAGDVQRLRDRCTTRVKEHVVAAFNKVLPTEALLYVPDEDFSGQDAFTFRSVLGGEYSADEAEVKLVVKPCREQICTRTVDTISCYNPEPDCDVTNEPYYDNFVTKSRDIEEQMRVNSFEGNGEQFIDDFGSTSALEIGDLGVAAQSYETLGPGYCTSAGERIEMCYYTSGYETEAECSALCTRDDDCQAYALGVWPGSREGENGATANVAVDDDYVVPNKSPWEQDAYIQAGTAGWCLVYTTASCEDGGVKANEGLPGKQLIDSDDVVHNSRVDGSSGDSLFTGCMSKLEDELEYFCWSASEDGYCDDSMELVSYSATLAECMEACVSAASNTGVSSVSGCTGIAFAESGYCYSYDSTDALESCDDWYPRQEAAIDGIVSYFIQPCLHTKQPA